MCVIGDHTKAVYFRADPVVLSSLFCVGLWLEGRAHKHDGDGSVDAGSRLEGCSFSDVACSRTPPKLRHRLGGVESLTLGRPRSK